MDTPIALNGHITIPLTKCANELYGKNIIATPSGLKEIDGLVTEGGGTILSVGREDEMGRGTRKRYNMLFPNLFKEKKHFVA
jgi:hypothetical protein